METLGSHHGPDGAGQVLTKSACSEQPSYPESGTAQEIPPSIDGSHGGQLQRCLIMTKAGRCVVNCAPRVESIDKDEPTKLAIGPLCRLLVTMHTFSGGSFLSFVEIDRFGVVLVDGGSFLVALVCPKDKTGGYTDIASIKLRALQVRHVFGQLHQGTVDEMQSVHEAEAQELLRSYTARSSGIHIEGGREPSTAPPFAHFETLYLRNVLKEPPYRLLWLQPLLSLQGVQRVYLLDLTDRKVVLAAAREQNQDDRRRDSGSVGCNTEHSEIFGPFLNQCWDIVFHYAHILAAGEPDADHLGTASRDEVLVMAFSATSAGAGLVEDVVVCLRTVRLSRPACLVALWQPLQEQHAGVSKGALPDLGASTAASQRRQRAQERAQKAAAAQENITGLPPRFRTQDELLRQLYFPSSFGLFAVRPHI